MRRLLSSRRARATALLGVVFVIFALTTSREHVNDDVYGAALASWRIGATGAPWLDGVATEEIGIARTHSGGAAVADNGHLVTARSPGVVAFAVPAYWVSAAGADPEDFTLGPEALTAAALAALTVLLFFLCVSRYLTAAASLASAAALGLATPVWSVAANGMWTHTVTTLGISGMAWAASRDRWWLVGLFGAIGLWGRVHVALAVAVVGVGVALSRRRPGIAVVVGLVSLTGLGLASLWTQWMYGSWRPTGGYSADYVTTVTSGGLGTVSGILVNQLGMWVSLDRGLLVWTPVLLLLAPAVVRSWRQLPDWSRWLLIGGLVYLTSQAYFSAFHGGDGFYGYRHGLEFLVAAAPAVALSTPRMGVWARRLLGPVLGAQAAAICVGAMSEGFYVLREDAWTSNGFWLALTHAPVVWVWLALMVVVGLLAGRVLRDRGLRIALDTGRT